LLALVLLALPGPALRHVSAATPVEQAAEELCVPHSDGATLAWTAPMHAAVSTEQPGQPCDGPGAEPGFACCISAQCPSALGTLPPNEAGSPRLPGAAVRYVPVAHARLGIEVPPSLPPPRYVA
jgi:hypothetical protein